MKRALISVSDKTNIVQFAKELVSFGYEIISTGGTKKYLETNDIAVTSVEEITGFPEILDGRVKTLHPNIHAAILCNRDNFNHVNSLNQLNIDYIDLVIVNLYPFKATVNSGCDLATAIENIDIGGPSMLRSAAKNYRDVTVICDFQDYNLVSKELHKNNEVSEATRLALCAKVFRHCAAYDSYIANYLSNGKAESHTVTYDLAYELRYGENPHQKAWFYQDDTISYSLSKSNILHGKQLSYNNILDASACLNILKEFQECAVVAIKHTNPCGVGVAETLTEAYEKAYLADSISIFGGIVGTNQVLTKEVAQMMNQIFLEIVIAPDFEPEALAILQQKKNLRILQVDMSSNRSNELITTVNGGILIQEYDNSTLDDLEVVCGNVNESMLDDLKFAFKVCKHVKSNAICVVKNQMTLGVGAGQMSRVGACKIALEAAYEKAQEGLILASDAFFPFEDAIELASQYNVVAIIQPGGSVNDPKIIEKCKSNNIALVFTNIRNFKH